MRMSAENPRAASAVDRLLSILDLEKVTVDDIMVPRNEVVGLDVNDDWDQILNQINQSQHTRMPVYEGELDNIVGILHLKAVARELTRGRFDRDLYCGTETPVTDGNRGRAWGDGGDQPLRAHGGHCRSARCVEGPMVGSDVFGGAISQSAQHGERLLGPNREQTHCVW